MAEFSAEVTQWLQLTGLLIQAAGDYAASGVENPDNTAMMRAIQVNAAALNAAMAAVQQTRLPTAPQVPFDAPQRAQGSPPPVIQYPATGEHQDEKPKP